jgi:uncharacterized protein (DUF1501 family)
VGAPALRLDRRRSLLQALDGAARGAGLAGAAGSTDAVTRRAFELLDSATVRAALDLQREPEAARERYGKTTPGQSLLLARRLVEAGVTCVTVNWAGIGVWDNHQRIFPSLKNDLLPPFDQSVSALLQDLAGRGLLESTLVVLAGEFGRTPKINADGGRDHWAGCYSLVMAGGGVQGGRVHGASDAEGAYPAEHPISPADVAATIYHCLGIRPDTQILDRLGRPVRLSDGQVIRGLL